MKKTAAHWPAVSFFFRWRKGPGDYFFARRLRSNNRPPESNVSAAAPVEASISGTELVPAKTMLLALRNVIRQPVNFIILGQ